MTTHARSATASRGRTHCSPARKGPLDRALLYVPPPGKFILLLALGGIALRLTLGRAEPPVAASAEPLPLYCPPDFDERFGFAQRAAGDLLEATQAVTHRIDMYL